MIHFELTVPYSQMIWSMAISIAYISRTTSERGMENMRLSDENSIWSCRKFCISRSFSIIKIYQKSTWAAITRELEKEMLLSSWTSFRNSEKRRCWNRLSMTRQSRISRSRNTPSPKYNQVECLSSWKYFRISPFTAFGGTSQENSSALRAPPLQRRLSQKHTILFICVLFILWNIQIYKLLKSWGE